MSISGIAASNEALTVTDRRLTPPPGLAYITRVRAYGLLLQPRLTAWPPDCTFRLLWLAVSVLHQHPCKWLIMCKYDFIHKTGNKRMATPPEEDRANAQKIW